MIYLASPYHHPEPDVMEDRFHKVAMATAHFLEQGLVVYSPIAHNHYLACNFNLPRDWPFWRKIDFGMLRHAEALYILTLPGWDKSVGVQAERDMAARLLIPTYLVDEEGKMWLAQ